jgi:hypothetical protein
MMPRQRQSKPATNVARYGFPSEEIKRRRISFFMIAFVGFLVGGCAYNGPEAIPSWTSYPIDLSTIVHEKIRLVPNIITLAARGSVSAGNDTNSVSAAGGILSGVDANLFTITRTREEKGDTAEHEWWVLPKTTANYSEDAMWQEAKRVGSNVCSSNGKKTDYRIVGSQYYYGSEGTLKFMNISTPAMRVTFRCPLDVISSDKDVIKLQSLTSSLPDTEYFDVVVVRYNNNVQVVQDAIVSYADGRGAKIVENRRVGEDHYVLVGEPQDEMATRSSPWRGKWRISRLAVLLTPENNDTKVTAKMLTFDVAIRERGVEVAGTKKDPIRLGIAPADRNWSYKRVVRLLGQLGQEYNLSPLGATPVDSPSADTTIVADGLDSPSDYELSVEKAQKKLNQLGYRAGLEDGILGPRTRSALEEYQRANGLSETGELTKATAQSLGLE